jgi:DNA-binding PadR family transcriptional regulator
VIVSREAGEEQMMAAACGAGDFGEFIGLEDLGAVLREFFACAGGLFGPAKRGLFAQTTGRQHGAGWDKMHGGRKGPGPWGGGFGGPWGAWLGGTSAPPGPPRGKKAGRGDVRAAILALLREGPLNGYQIMSEIEERSNGAWRPSPGAVYPALSQLADEGLIEGAESAGRRMFSLSAAGREYVEQNPDMARGAWESPAQQEAWEVPGLFAEAARLGGGIVQIAHNGNPDQVRAAERLLQRTRRDLYRILASDEDDQDSDEQDA